MKSISYENKGDKCKIDNWNWKDVNFYKLLNVGFDINFCCFGLMWNIVEENFVFLLLFWDLNIYEKNISCLWIMICKFSLLKISIK